MRWLVNISYFYFYFIFFNIFEINKVLSTNDAVLVNYALKYVKVFVIYRKHFHLSQYLTSWSQAKNTQQLVFFINNNALRYQKMRTTCHVPVM